MNPNSKVPEAAIPQRIASSRWLGRCLLPAKLAIVCFGLAGCSEQKMGQVAGHIVYSESGAVATELSGYRVSFLCHQDQGDGKQNRVTATGMVGKDGRRTARLP